MKLSQTARFAILVLYAVLLFGVCRFLFGTWLSPNAAKCLWLYASFAHLLHGTHRGVKGTVVGLFPGGFVATRFHT